MSELVTRAILKEEFSKFRTELSEELSRFRTELSKELNSDWMSALRMVQADMERNLGLALEPMKDLLDQIKKLDGLPERVTKLEGLPERVTKLEAKVFPPRRAARRR
jgi:hypothetical protein